MGRPDDPPLPPPRPARIAVRAAMTVGITVRPATDADAAPLAAMLNHIIAAGGTTAFEADFTPASFAARFVRGADLLACHVALDPESREPMGFQSLERAGWLGEGWADIATFTRREKPVPGAGRALTRATLARARPLGIRHINATIRADNAGGLAFYSCMGFVPYARALRVPLADGTPVDRLHHRLDL